MNEKAGQKTMATEKPAVEIVFNLWYVYDASGKIHALRARPYILPGNDDDKLAFMEAFASTDFLIARQFPVPGPFRMRHGEETEFQVQDMEGPQALAVFEECMGTLMEELPPQTHMELPPDPLVNLTPLYLDRNGVLHPVMDSRGPEEGASSRN